MNVNFIIWNYDQTLSSHLGYLIGNPTGEGKEQH